MRRRYQSPFLPLMWNGMETRGTRWLGTRDAAHALGVTYREVYALIDRGELPAYKVGRDIKLLRAEVDAYRQDRFGT